MLVLRHFFRCQRNQKKVDPTMDDLIGDFRGVVLADKGFIDDFRQQELAEKKGGELFTRPRKKMDVQLPGPVYIIF